MSDKFVKARDAQGNPIEVASENGLGVVANILYLLRRIVKLLESNAVTDSQQRQKVVVEGTVAASLAASSGTSVISGTVTANIAGSAGVGSLVANTAAGSPYASSSQTAQLVMEGPVSQEWRIIDAARTSFAVGIRTKLT